MTKANYKEKIINDPVFGFIDVGNKFINSIIKHPYFQRLTRIKQLGLTYLVYPGAQHSRMSHSLGAMYLMGKAIDQLRSKGHSISSKEGTAALACILMHDFGHSPFSHALEHTLVKEICHEEISLLLIQKLNQETKGKLDLVISLFKNEYSKQFLHQLVSGQLDMDRLDYLRRDSFFSGVTEGNIGSTRIIKMLNVKNNRLVVEEKGIHSIENFLMARKLMFLQVYLHKTVLAAEKMLINLFKRAQQLAKENINLFVSPSLHFFLKNSVDKLMFHNNSQTITHFVHLDDNDIFFAAKVWSQHKDKVLSILSNNLVHRNLFGVEIRTNPFELDYLRDKQKKLAKKHHISFQEASFLLASDEVYTNIYSEPSNGINVLYKNGTIRNISEISGIELPSNKTNKYYLCFLKT